MSTVIETHVAKHFCTALKLRSKGSSDVLQGSSNGNDVLLTLSLHQCYLATRIDTEGCVAAKSDVPNITTLICKVVLVTVLGEQGDNSLQMVIIFYVLSWDQLN
jgi:hypothetical protein